MAAALNSSQKLMQEIGRALWHKGFRPVDGPRIASYLTSKACTKEGRAVIAGERIFNLGLEGKRSNVFVFTQIDPMNETVRVLMASPRSDVNAPVMDEGELAMREEFRGVNESEIPKIAERVANRAASEAAAKDPKEYRMQCHVHTCYAFNGSRYFDDGISNIADIIRRAMLYNTDVLVLTTHNSIPVEKFLIMDTVCRLAGITAIIGTELTVPLLERHVNGPHHLVFMGNQEAAAEVQGRILSRRDPELSMQSYWRSADGNMLLDDVYRELSDLRQSGAVALGAAHPFNYISGVLPAKVLGLLSAVDVGQLSLNEAIARAGSLDFIEVMNRSISPDVMRFSDPSLYRWISGLVRTHILNNDSIAGSDMLRERVGPADIMSANMCSLALGMWLESRGMRQQTFGSDDHCTPPLDWRYLRGGYFEAGFSFFRSERRLGAEEIVRGIAKGDLGLSAHIYAAATDKGLRIPEARTHVPKELEETWNKLKSRHFLNYVKVLMADAANFLGNEPGMIGKMDK